MIRALLRGRSARAPAATGPHGDELLLVKLRYKQPEGDVSRLLQVPLRDSLGSGAGSTDFRFAASVAWFGMALRGSPHAGKAPWGRGRGADPQGYRAEMIRLIEAARRLSQSEGRAAAGPDPRTHSAARPSRGR